MNTKSVIKKQSVLIYFILVFLISWGGSFLLVGPKFLRGEVMDLTDIGLMAIPMLGGPFFAGLGMIYLVENKEGLTELFSRMGNWRTERRWYGPLVIFPTLLLIVSLILSVLVDAELAPALFVFGIVLGLFAGFFEEIGWTGFAFPRMSKKENVLSTSIIFGIVHAIWHIFPDYLGNFNSFGEYWLPYIFGFCVHVVALRVLIVWVYTNTNSLFLATLMHASSTGFYSFFISITISHESTAIFFLVYGFILWIPAVLVSLKFGRTMKA